MLKSPPPQSAHHHRQHRASLSSEQEQSPPVIATTATSSDSNCGKLGEKDVEPLSLTAADSSSKYEDAASSCDADDEEVVEGGWGYYGKRDVIKPAVAQDDDQPLDFSCKSSRKRSVEEGDGGGDNKKVKWGEERPGPALKRKHLRKKKSKKGVRPSVISFAGATSSNTSSSAGKSDNGGSLHNTSAAESCGGGTSISTNSGGCSSGGESSSSSSASSGTHQERRRVMRSQRKRLMMSAGKVFDVDEHFRRSLGGVLYEQVVGGGFNGVVGGGLGGSGVDLKRENAGKGDGTSSVRVIIEEGDVKPSDVDDHFAKALGSETWSRIVKQGSNKNASSTSITPPPPPAKKLSDSTGHRTPDNHPTISSSDKDVQDVPVMMMRHCDATSNPPLIIPKLPLKPNENNHRQSSFKIENLLGTSSSSTKRRSSGDDGDAGGKRVCNNGI